MSTATSTRGRKVATLAEIRADTARLRRQAAGQPWARQGMVMVDALEYDELKVRIERLEALCPASPRRKKS